MSVTMTTTPATRPRPVAISIDEPRTRRDANSRSPPARSKKTVARGVLRARKVCRSGAYHVADAGRQGIDREGLCHHFHARLEEAVRHRGVLGISGNEQNLKAGALLARGFGDLTAIHARQADIAHQQ